MLRIFVLLLLIMLTSNGVSAQRDVTSDEYSVYSDLINELYPDGVCCLAVYKTVSSHDLPKRISRELLLSSDIVRDFDARSRQAAELTDRFNTRIRVVLPDDDELRQILVRPDDELSNNGSWENFRSKYKSYSLESFSRVGFNARRTQALVVLGSQYGWLAGTGHFYFLEKVGGSWKVKKKVQAWVS